jgi:hypothetical protein
MKASESIRKNRRTWAARPPFAQGGTVERPTVAAVNDQPQPGESREGVPEPQDSEDSEVRG